MATVPHYASFLLKGRSRPVFVCGARCDLPSLSRILTGSSKNIDGMSKIMMPAKIYGYARSTVKDCEDLTIIKRDLGSSVDGYLVLPISTRQRQNLHAFHSEKYKLDSVLVYTKNAGAVEGDVYVWAGDAETVSFDPGEWHPVM